MDRSPRIGTPHRRSARSAHPSRSYPGDERRQLPSQAKPPQTDTFPRTLKYPHAQHASGEKGLFRYAPEPFSPEIPTQLSTQPLAYFYSAELAWFCSALDRAIRRCNHHVSFSANTAPRVLISSAALGLGLA